MNLPRLPKPPKLLKPLWRAYSLAGAAVLTAALILAAVGIATGRASAARLRAVGEAVLGPAPGASVPDAGSAGTAAAGTAPAAAAGTAAAPAKELEAPPAELLREIRRAADDLRLWEDRIDLLGGDLKKSLLLVDEKGRSYQQLDQGWQRVQKAFVPLLNEVLREAPGWRPLAEDEFLAALRAEGDGGDGAGGDAAAGGAPRPRPITGAIEALRAREARFAEAEKSLAGLAPDVLAGIFSSSLKAGGPEAGGAEPARSSAGLREDQMVRLVAAMEPGKVAKIFKSLREEDPAGAAFLLSRVLERIPGTGPGGSGAAGGPAAGSSGDDGGEKRG